jgi:hypothetical protein
LDESLDLVEVGSKCVDFRRLLGKVSVELGMGFFPLGPGGRDGGLKGGLGGSEVVEVGGGLMAPIVVRASKILFILVKTVII